MWAGNASIRRLNLGGNNIGDKGATVLAEMLKVLSILSALPGRFTLEIIMSKQSR